MSYILLDGRKTALNLQEKLKEEINILINKTNRQPHLGIILIGDDLASSVYVAAKIKACEKIGIKASRVHFPNNVSQEELLNKIKEFNQNSNLHGFIVQLPLPIHLDAQEILYSINPKKDVDGFHPTNIGAMVLGGEGFLPATPLGILNLLKAYNINIKGQKVVILGRSNIVGRPLSILLSQKGWDATTTLLHSQSKNIETELYKADIVIAAIGIPNFIKASHIKPGCVVIDVGISRLPDASSPLGYKFCGDVDFDNVAPNTSYITPVPGGVGPMTITMLLKNTLQAFKYTIN